MFLDKSLYLFIIKFYRQLKLITVLYYFIAVSSIRIMLSSLYLKFLYDEPERSCHNTEFAF